jgi:hypothetical protein
MLRVAISIPVNCRYVICSQVSWRDGNVVFLHESLLDTNDVVNSTIGMELGLDVLKNDDGAVSSSTTMM